ncbi:DUF3465 domain-containing protein [Methyloprofundus sp.]|uniref:DUF3465 domain-containing protein n=1 Tax=Methyloprofundus sp. TaxID=2020875 RepID=UPI003D09C3DD
MRVVLLFVLYCFSFVVSADRLSDSNQLFDYAETAFPQFFSPAGGSTYEIDDYLVRHYPDTDNYVGIKADEVFVYGDIFNGLLKVGNIADFIELEPDYDEILAELYASGTSDVQVRGVGTVLIILADDLQGSRHQRFIIELASGQTLLIAHNIDLAPKINVLSLGDAIEFFGEYEWNEQGWVIHWTHYDPAGKHEDGWVLHDT